MENSQVYNKVIQTDKRTDKQSYRQIFINHTDRYLFRSTTHTDYVAGMGRNSSRVARRRIANSNVPADEDTLDEDELEAWTTSKPKRAKVKRTG